MSSYYFPCCSQQVIAENLSEEEISELKVAFKMIDTDNSGQITLEKLKAGLKMLGNNLSEPEILDLMQAVSISTESSYNSLVLNKPTFLSFFSCLAKQFLLIVQ